MASSSAKRLAILLPGAIVLWVGVRWGGEVLRWMEPDTPSRSIGQPGAGRLEHGKRLPARGANFRVYSDLGHLLGRTCVHGTVRDVVVAAYATLAATHPERTWVVGETGWCGGGPFSPHRTHQSGLSVDFMAPMRSASGRATTLPDAPWLRWGYGVDLDPTGRAPNGDTIDLAAVSAHLEALDAAARARGLRITKVVLDPALRARLPDPPASPGPADAPGFDTTTTTTSTSRPRDGTFRLETDRRSYVSIPPTYPPFDRHEPDRGAKTR